MLEVLLPCSLVLRCRSLARLEVGCSKNRSMGNCS
jgi:hypothetical protein